MTCGKKLLAVLTSIFLDGVGVVAPDIDLRFLLELSLVKRVEPAHDVISETVPLEVVTGMFTSDGCREVLFKCNGL